MFGASEGVACQEACGVLQLIVNAWREAGLADTPKDPLLDYCNAS